MLGLGEGELHKVMLGLGEGKLPKVMLGLGEGELHKVMLGPGEGLLLANWCVLFCIQTIMQEVACDHKVGLPTVCVAMVMSVVPKVCSCLFRYSLYMSNVLSTATLHSEVWMYSECYFDTFPACFT